MCSNPNRISLISPVPLIILEEEGLEGYKWLGRQVGREDRLQGSPDFPSSLGPAATTPAFPRDGVVTARDHPPEKQIARSPWGAPEFGVLREGLYTSVKATGPGQLWT